MEEQLLQISQRQKPSERRSILNKHMSELNNRGQGCSDCLGGWCCTYEFNSMQMTPLETLDMYFYLLNSGRLNQDLINLLKENQAKFRLDKVLMIGKGEYLRRNYTCPFFADKAQGCTIGKNNKPYGCLAFNALEVGVEQPGHCESNHSIFKTQLDKNNDESINQEIKNILKLDWDKKDIPSALLELLRCLRPDEFLFQ